MKNVKIAMPSKEDQRNLYTAAQIDEMKRVIREEWDFGAEGVGVVLGEDIQRAACFFGGWYKFRDHDEARLAEQRAFLAPGLEKIAAEIATAEGHI